MKNHPATDKSTKSAKPIHEKELPRIGGPRDPENDPSGSGGANPPGSDGPPGRGN